MPLQKSSSNFTTATIVSQNTDGWQSNWASSYLNILSGTPNQLRVSGTAPASARTFSNVQANNQHTLTYTQAQNNAVQLVVEQSGNGTTWSTVLSTTTSNGTHTQTFTPSASHIWVRYSASDSFQVSEVVLNGVEEIMVVNVTLGGFAKYRYGFNGYEADNEIKGDRNSYTTEFRQYDPRVARWLSLDPKTHHEYSPYSAFDNNPIYYVDPEGADSEGENKDDLNTNEPPATPSAEEKPMTESIMPPPAYKDNFKKIFSDKVGTEYSAAQRKELSSQFDGNDKMKKIKEENGVSKFELTLGAKAKRASKGVEKIEVKMVITKIPIIQKETDKDGKVKWETKVREVVKLEFSSGGFMSWDGNIFHDYEFEKEVYIYKDIAYTKREGGKYLPKFVLD